MTWIFKLTLLLLRAWDWVFSRLDYLQLKYYYRIYLWATEGLEDQILTPTGTEEECPGSWADIQ